MKSLQNLFQCHALTSMQNAFQCHVLTSMHIIHLIKPHLLNMCNVYSILLESQAYICVNAGSCLLLLNKPGGCRQMGEVTLMKKLMTMHINRLINSHLINMPNIK